MTGGWRKLRNEELIVCTLHQMFRTIKSRRMRWEGHVARIGEMRNAYKVLVENPER
jgi:hypothetical protein